MSEKNHPQMIAQINAPKIGLSHIFGILLLEKNALKFMSNPKNGQKICGIFKSSKIFDLRRQGTVENF